MDQTLEAFFVLIDNAKVPSRTSDAIRAKTCASVRPSATLERMRTRVRHDQIDVLLQEQFLLFFLKAGSVRRTRWRAE